MKRGEKCKVVLKSDYAYGARGSPPKIPANATLVFEIELFEFDNEVDVTKDRSGGIRKLETKLGEGAGDAEFDATVKVEYSIARLDGSVLVEKQTVSYRMGDETLPAHVQDAIATLRVGGAAKFTIKSGYAYGDAGNEAIGIKGGETTVWNIELLDLQNPPDASDMSTAEKLAFANIKKTEGNTFFGQQKWKRALDLYDFAAKYTKYIAGDEAKLAEDLKAICRLNAAQCYLKLHQYEDAVKRCSDVLKADPKNMKGLYRRALAHEGLKSWTSAAEDLELLLQVDASNQDALRELHKVRAHIKAEESRERQVFSRMFQ